MARMPAASLVLSIALAVGACVSGDGSSLFSKSPPGVATKVVLLEVTDENRGTLVVGSQTINLLERRTDVYDIRRADARNQIYVLVDAGTSTDSLADSCGMGVRVRVVNVAMQDAQPAR